MRHNSGNGNEIESPVRARCLENKGADVGFRFSIGQSLLLIAIAAVGIAAVLNPSALWLSVVTLMTRVACLGGVLAAIYLPGKPRAFWLGFVLFAIGYRVLDLGAVDHFRLAFRGQSDSNGPSTFFTGQIGRGYGFGGNLSRDLVDLIGLGDRTVPLEVGEAVQARSPRTALFVGATVREIGPQETILIEFDPETFGGKTSIPARLVRRADGVRERVYEIGENVFVWGFSLCGGLLALWLRGRGLRSVPSGGGAS